MSELKAYWIPTRSGNSCHCYLKSEADKVIAHHKYKRCLDKAQMCWSEVMRLRWKPLYDMNKHEFWKYKHKFWERWRISWLELADKFKPNEGTK